jgi:hypothetical protein
MRDFSEFKAMLETRLGELDARVHKIEDRLDDPVSKDWRTRPWSARISRYSRISGNPA